MEALENQSLLGVMSPKNTQLTGQIALSSSVQSRQLREWSGGNHIQLPLMGQAGDHSGVCTPGGKGKLKGRCTSFKIQEKECKLLCGHTRQNIVVPIH